MAVCKRVGRNNFDYGGLYSYTLNANGKRSVSVEIYGEGRRPIISEKIGGLTTRHAVIRAHRYARRCIDRLIKKRFGTNEMNWMIRDIRPENVL